MDVHLASADRSGHTAHIGSSARYVTFVCSSPKRKTKRKHPPTRDGIISMRINPQAWVVTDSSGFRSGVGTF